MTLLLPPLGLAPMWAQMEDSTECCGFIRTMKSVTNWRVVKHGSLQIDRGKMQNKGSGPRGALATVKLTQRNGTREVRLPSNTKRSAEEGRREKRRDKHAPDILKRATLVPLGPGQLSLEPSLAFRTRPRLPFLSRQMSKSSSSSHAQRQGSPRWKGGWRRLERMV